MINHWKSGKLLLALLLSVSISACGGSGSAGPSSPDAVASQLERMSVREKIGQLLVIGFEGTDTSAEVEYMVKERHVGGLILYKRNIVDAEQTMRLISRLKTFGSDGIPLFIAVDEEGGRVSRFPQDLTKLPPADSIGRKDDPELAESLARQAGLLAKALGYNMNFAPVLDVNSNPANPVIGDRAYGTTADRVVRIGLAAMKGYADAGVIPVVKHFPGHGDTATDSHTELPVVRHDRNRLEETELKPFRSAAENGARAVMVGHLLVTALDGELPSSLSPATIDGLLRDRWKFDGVVVTDDLTMGAVTNHVAVGDAALQALLAGCDILLVGHGLQNALDVFDRLVRAYESGELSEERIDASVRRILQLKADFRLQDEPNASLQNVRQQNERLAAALAEAGF